MEYRSLLANTTSFYTSDIEGMSKFILDVSFSMQGGSIAKELHSEGVVSHGVASFRKSMVSRSGTERLILNCLGWLLTGDIELDKYLGFIFKKYHGSYDGTHKSQAVDLAGFLLYMEFDPEREPAGSWKRVVKP